MLRQNIVIVLALWTAAFLTFALLGVVLASTGLMGQLMMEGLRTGQDPLELAQNERYGGLFAETQRKVQIARVLIFPLLSAVLGAAAGSFTRNRVLMVAGLSLVPLLLFEPIAMGFSSTMMTWPLIYLLVGCAAARVLNRRRLA